MERLSKSSDELAREVGTKRQFVVWGVAALIAIALLVGAVVRHNRGEPRWGYFLVGDPHTGARLFFEKKGCAHCHSVSGSGGKLAPDLGYQREVQAGLNQLVTAMWNHAPRMWERMRKEKVNYPDLRNDEMAHLFAFLYAARYVDEPGDPIQGQRLFQVKGCLRCHAVRGQGGDVGPDLAKVSGVDTPIRWTQAMWNHAPAMEAGVRRLNLSWPKFEGREMNDLLAYIRGLSGGLRRETELLPASPERGWKIFQEKSCLSCHSVRGKGGKLGPELGPRRHLPLTIVQFAGLMWNHSPEMWQALKAQSIPRPKFEGQELADLVAFLSSLRYFEPVGSPLVGQTSFAERGCDHCHGAQGQGTRLGPTLRGGGRVTTSITLATALWGHGPNMYKRAQELGRPWPTLTEADVGDLVAFLNSEEEGRH